MDPATTESGETVFVDKEDPLTGSNGPFYVVYKSKDQEERFGFMCSVCETLDNAMDPMGRIVCNDCGNTRKPDEWDAVKG